MDQESICGISLNLMRGVEKNYDQFNIIAVHYYPQPIYSEERGKEVHFVDRILVQAMANGQPKQYLHHPTNTDLYQFRLLNPANAARLIAASKQVYDAIDQ